MHELMFQAGVKGMSERSELIPCHHYTNTVCDAEWDGVYISIVECYVATQ